MEQSPKQHLNNALNHAEEYIDTQLDIIKLQTAKHTGKVVAYVTAVFLVSVFVLVCYITANIAAALYINAKINNIVVSFLIVSASNLVFALLVVMMKKIIIHPVQNIIIRLITE